MSKTASAEEQFQWVMMAEELAESAEFATEVAPSAAGLIITAEAPNADLEGSTAKVQVDIDWNDLAELENPKELLKIAIRTVTDELREMVATRH